MKDFLSAPHTPTRRFIVFADEAKEIAWKHHVNWTSNPSESNATKHLDEMMNELRDLVEAFDLALSEQGETT